MITALGVDVVEGNAPEPRGVVVNRNVTISHSSHVQVGTGNTQNVTLTIQKLVEAVEHSDAPEPEKKKAKALIQKLSENRLLATVIGSLIGSQIS